MLSRSRDEMTSRRIRLLLQAAESRGCPPAIERTLPVRRLGFVLTLLASSALSPSSPASAQSACQGRPPDFVTSLSPSQNRPPFRWPVYRPWLNASLASVE